MVRPERSAAASPRVVRIRNSLSAEMGDFIPVAGTAAFFWGSLDETAEGRRGTRATATHYLPSLGTRSVDSIFL